MAISRFQFFGTFMCPKCSSPWISSCCGSSTTATCFEMENPKGPPQKRRKRKKDDECHYARATGDKATEEPVMPTETVMEFSQEPQAIQLSYEHGVSSSEVADSAPGIAGISDFLGRPILIHRLEWEVGNTTAPAPFVISPWELFVTNHRVSQKLSAYKLLRGTLKIRIMVNGSPFHYGRLFVGMKPGFVSWTNNTVDLDPMDNATIRNYYDGATQVTWQPNKVFYSQRPHVLINPNTNAVAEITWPMFVNVPWIDLRAAVVADEAQRLGQLEIWELNYLQHAANATAATLHVTFFAWMEDVELSGATPFATATARKQKGKSSKTTNPETGGDEYNNDGIVSMPASALAEFAGKFTDYSFIGPYAKATQIGANAVSSIAKIFGWSKPLVLDKECINTRIQAGRMANTMGTSPMAKLSLDPKQELSVDPGLLDLPRMDEMSFTYISQIESLVYQEEISSDDLGHIVGFAVTPQLAPAFVNSSVNYVSGTPVGNITVPFAKWRGSLVFRFQFVVSKMHRGRFLLVYTPEVNGTLSTNTMNVEANSHFSQVIDLSEDTDVSYEVKWAQPQIWAKTKDIPMNSIDKWLNTGAGDLDVLNINCNGRLDLYVINNLAIASNDDTTAYMNIYMRAGDDYHVAQPHYNPSRYSYSHAGGTFALSTAAVDPAIVSNSEEDLSTQTIAKVINPAGSEISAESLFLTYMGEQIHSIRALIKRMQAYTILEGYGSTTNGEARIFSRIMTLFPIGRSGGRYGTSGLDQYGSAANVWMTYLRWFAQGYVGYRGGVRYLVTAPGVGARGVWRGFRVTSEHRDFQDVSISIGGTAKQNFYTLMGGNSMPTVCSDQHNLNGQQIQSGQDSNTFAVEIPWYSGFRFGYLHTAQQGNAGEETQSTVMYNSWTLSYDLPSDTGNVNRSARVYVAASEDTQFHFFYGFPAYCRILPPNTPA